MTKQSLQPNMDDHHSLLLACSIHLGVFVAFFRPKLQISSHIGAGTGPAGPAMAGPFSAEVETKVCVRLLCGLVPRLNYCSKFPAEYVRKCARVRLTFSMAKLPDLPGECNESAS